MTERPKTVIVGYDGQKSSEDALTLGIMLAELTGSRLLLAFAHQPGPHVRERAERTLRRGLRSLRYGQPAGIWATEADSPAAMLSELARQEAAHVIVVGTGAAGDGEIGPPKHVAEHLLTSTPCAVALAPNGFRSREQPKRHVAEAAGGWVVA